MTKCFKKLAFYAISSNVSSVHMPRIGYDKRNISWYAIERLISHILVSKGIHTYIYYFNRRGNAATSNIISIKFLKIFFKNFEFLINLFKGLMFVGRLIIKYDFFNWRNSNFSLGFNSLWVQKDIFSNIIKNIAK